MIHPLRQAVITEARTWVTPRTPFHHQACVKGVGVDCLQLIRAVGEATSVMRPVTAADKARFGRFYGRRPQPVEMRECLATFLEEISPDQAKPGDLAWTHWGNDFPIHMAILSEFDGRPTFIDAIWKYGTAEQTLTSVFTERVAAYWRYPVIAEAETS